MESELRDKHAEISQNFSLRGHYTDNKRYSEVEQEILEGERGVKPVIASIAERTDYIAESKYQLHDLHDLVAAINVQHKHENSEPLSDICYYPMMTGLYSPEICLGFKDLLKHNPSKTVHTKKQSSTGRYKPGNGLLSAEKHIDQEVDEFVENFWDIVEEDQGFGLKTRQEENIRSWVKELPFYEEQNFDEWPQPFTI